MGFQIANRFSFQWRPSRIEGPEDRGPLFPRDPFTRACFADGRRSKMPPVEHRIQPGVCSNKFVRGPRVMSDICDTARRYGATATRIIARRICARVLRAEYNDDQKPTLSVLHGARTSHPGLSRRNPIYRASLNRSAARSSGRNFAA